MKVNPNQNSSIPTPAQQQSIKDGTSNTLQHADSSKPEKPFAKDGFEEFQSSRNFTFPAQDASSKDSAAYFNPKEVSIDKTTPFKKSSTSNDSEDDAASKNSLIVYNGHAGLGENR